LADAEWYQMLDRIGVAKEMISCDEF